MLKQVETDLSYTYQRTAIGLEIRSQAELDGLMAALGRADIDVVVLHDAHRDITIHIYLRFREHRHNVVPQPRAGGDVRPHMKKEE